MREELDATRHLPMSLARKMAETKLFQLHVPRSIGGPELSPLTVIHIIEELSKVDGSVGWCALIAGAISVSTG